MAPNGRKRPAAVSLLQNPNRGGSAPHHCVLSHIKPASWHQLSHNSTASSATSAADINRPSIFAFVLSLVIGPEKAEIWAKSNWFKDLKPPTETPELKVTRGIYRLYVFLLQEATFEHVGERNWGKFKPISCFSANKELCALLWSTWKKRLPELSHGGRLNTVSLSDFIHIWR